MELQVIQHGNDLSIIYASHGIGLKFTPFDASKFTEERWRQFAENMRNKKRDILEFLPEDNFCEGGVSMGTADGVLDFTTSKSFNVLPGGGSLSVAINDAYGAFSKMLAGIDFVALLKQDD